MFRKKKNNLSQMAMAKEINANLVGTPPLRKGGKGEGKRERRDRNGGDAKGKKTNKQQVPVEKV